MENKHLPHEHGRDTETLLSDLPDPESCIQVAETFSLISDGTRLRILWLLCHTEDCVSDIAAAVGMSAPAVSHHLRLLRQAGLITSKRAGKEIYYRLADTTHASLVHRMIDDIFDFQCPVPSHTHFHRQEQTE